MLILGVDPGLKACGVVIIDYKANIKFTETIYTREGDLSDRLNLIYKRFVEILEEWNPNVAVIESTIYYRNVKTALNLGAVRGVLLLAISKKGIPIKEISPTRVKLALTGMGRAKKNQVAYMVDQFIGSHDDLTEHEFDAIGVCLAFLKEIDNALRIGRQSRR